MCSVSIDALWDCRHRDCGYTVCCVYIVDTDTGPLQRLHRDAATLVDLPIMSVDPTSWNWQTNGDQDKISKFQVHANQ